MLLVFSPEGQHVLGELELLVFDIGKVQRKIDAVCSLRPLHGGGVDLLVRHFPQLYLCHGAQNALPSTLVFDRSRRLEHRLKNHLLKLLLK